MGVPNDDECHLNHPLNHSEHITVGSDTAANLSRKFLFATVKMCSIKVENCVQPVCDVGNKRDVCLTDE